MSVGIVSYGLGNIGSLTSSLNRIGCDVSVLEDPREAHKHSHLIIPGVGHYATAARLMSSRGWHEAMTAAHANGAAILGICLGMQLLLEGSSEAPAAAGLGLIAGAVEHLSGQGCLLRVPHVGWNSVTPSRESILFGAAQEPLDFYFVHSYGLAVPHPAVVATTEYDVLFGASVETGNVFGVQFHPEKSSISGRSLLVNFIKYQPC